MTKKITISALLLLSAHFVFAQDIRLAGVENFDYFKAPVKNSDGNYESSFREFGAFASFPMQSKNEKTTIINGFQYALVQASVLNNGAHRTGSRDFQSITYNFSIIQSLTDKWKIAASLMPSLASDFKDKLSSEDFFIQGYLVGVRKLNDFTSLGGGISYTTELGSPLLLPAVYFRYSRGRQNVNVQLPMLAEYAYSVDAKDKLNVGFRMSLNGTNFHVTGDDNNSDLDVNKLRYSRINAGPVVGYKICNVLKLEATGGISVARKFEFMTAGGANQYTFNSNNTGFININLSLIAPSRNRAH
jgi:hypothetical protein